MKTIFTCAAVACFIAGCASTETGTVSYDSGGRKVYGLNDQPQTSVAGTGSLMPGAYNNRSMQTGQFTGQERTPNLIGQRPALPREADPRELARSPDATAGMGTGAGSLGQSGVLPDREVSTDTIMETTPPAVGGAPTSVSGVGSSTNAPSNPSDATTVIQPARPE